MRELQVLQVRALPRRRWEAQAQLGTALVTVMAELSGPGRVWLTDEGGTRLPTRLELAELRMAFSRAGDVTAGLTALQVAVEEALLGPVPLERLQLTDVHDEGDRLECSGTLDGRAGTITLSWVAGASLTVRVLPPGGRCRDRALTTLELRALVAGLIDPRGARLLAVALRELQQRA